MKKKKVLQYIEKVKDALFFDEDAEETLENLFQKVHQMDESYFEEIEEEMASESQSDKDKFPLPKTFEAEKAKWALFSDGACRGNPGPGSYGAMAQNASGDVLFRLSGVEYATTNNKMELTGAIMALKKIKDEENFSPRDKTQLYTDSRYVMDGIEKWLKGWKARGWKKSDGKTILNLELWQELDEIVMGFKNLKFYWVKGHSGHPQNEFCDQLANEALDEILL